MYIPGTDNVVADALSRIYSNDSPGTVRAASEYVYSDVVNEDPAIETTIALPVLAGLEAQVAVQRKPRKPRTQPLPPETGRPKTSKEFSKRVHGHFVLKGPSE